MLFVSGICKARSVRPAETRTHGAALCHLSVRCLIALPGIDRSVSVSAQWFELVTGGDRPQFLLIEERLNWDGVGGKGELDALKNETEKTKISEETVKTVWSSVRTIYAETWHYRADLSRLRKSKRTNRSHYAAL